MKNLNEMKQQFVGCFTMVDDAIIEVDFTRAEKILTVLEKEMKEQEGIKDVKEIVTWFNEVVKKHFNS